jgi:hypothetical protein
MRRLVIDPAHLEAHRASRPMTRPWRCATWSMSLTAEHGRNGFVAIAFANYNHSGVTRQTTSDSISNAGFSHQFVQPGVQGNAPLKLAESAKP